MNHYEFRQRQLIAQLKTERPKEPEAARHSIQQNFESDARICLTLVHFIPQQLAGSVVALGIEPLRKLEPDFHYYPPSSMHMTIKNVRAIANPPAFTTSDIQAVQRMLETLCPQLPSFKVRFEGTLLLSNSVSVVGFSDERLHRAVQEIDAGLRRIGLPDDKKYFSEEVFFSTISICRFSHTPSLQFYDAVGQLDSQIWGELEVDAASLISCNLVCARKHIYGSYKLT